MSDIANTIAARIARAELDEPADDEVREQAKRSRDPAAACALHSLMSSISEECYAAGWMLGLDEALWDMMGGGSRRYGQGEDDSDDCSVMPVSVDALRHLSAVCGGWWTWHDDTTGASKTDTREWGPRFVTTDEWCGPDA